MKKGRSCWSCYYCWAAAGELLCSFLCDLVLLKNSVNSCWFFYLCILSCFFFLPWASLYMIAWFDYWESMIWFYVFVNVHPSVPPTISLWLFICVSIFLSSSRWWWCWWWWNWYRKVAFFKHQVNKQLCMWCIHDVLWEHILISYLSHEVALSWATELQRWSVLQVRRGFLVGLKAPPLSSQAIYLIWLPCGTLLTGEMCEILFRTAQATVALTKFKPVWNDRSISLSSKIWLMCSIFLYACESWTLTAELQRRIQAMEMRCYHKLLHISYKDHVTNEEAHAKIQ